MARNISGRTLAARLSLCKVTNDHTLPCSTNDNNVMDDSTRYYLHLSLQKRSD